MSYDKNKVKAELSMEDIYILLDSLNAEPQQKGEVIVARTICHNDEDGSHKLYYYHNEQNGGLFHCYTECGDSFDVFELISRVKDIDLNAAIYYIVNFFNLQHKISEVAEENLLNDWQILKRYNEVLGIQISNEYITLPELDKNLLKYYPHPRFLNWEKDFIPKEISDYMGVCYDPVHGGILIPHYDVNDRLVGVRIRTLVQEEEDKGKYKPAIIQNHMTNHPLSFNLYGLNKAKDNIKDMKLAIITESEKGVMQIMSYLGTENNIAVSMCGSTLSQYQFQLLLDCGVSEIAIAIDKDYQELGDKNYNQIIQKMNKMYNKFHSKANISFIFDVENYTGYKMSPTDAGKDVFLHLWRNRFI